MLRFFDNRQESLLDQLPELIQTHCAATTRNYLGMGSGFYESSNDGSKIPSVLRSIVDRLQNADGHQEATLLTRSPEIDVFVNPENCQAVAKAANAIANAGWTVRDAGKPEYFGATSRSLHAKFIFSANERDNSNLCNSAWLYLGSGNLTGPGFDNKAHPKGGNLEAGVVLAPKSLRWEEERGVSPNDVVTNVLPVQWNPNSICDGDSLNPGEDMPALEIQYRAAPVACLLWSIEENVGWLRTMEVVAERFDVLESGNACHWDITKGFQWPGTPPLQPQQVFVRWQIEQEELTAWVPVLDSFGRLAATTLRPIDIEEAWGQLANFPMPPDDEELLPEGDDVPPPAVPPQPISGISATANYPVRQMMQLIENIAAKQTSVSKADWSTWCTRFEQCLTQAAGSPVLAEFLKLGLNPLSPLWCSPFRPDFVKPAETPEPEAKRYEEALARVEESWKVAGLKSLGGEP